jgi:RND superfamily putative drug exporter
MTGALYRLGHAAARHYRIFIPVWLAVVVAVVLLANAGGRPTNNNLDLPGTGSQMATNLLEKGLPQQANGSVQIVLEATDGTLSSGSNMQAVQKTVDELKRDRYVASVISPFSPEGAAAISGDQKIGFISLFLNLSSGELSEEEAAQIFSKTAPASDAGLEVSAGGYLGAALSVPETNTSDRIGVIAAILILIGVFGTVTAMTLPLFTALAALLVGLGLIGFLGELIPVPQVAPTLGTMLGLAVGIDYSLFIISRHQRQLRAGMEAHESAARALASAGGAVVFAGSTVIIALLCLYFGGVDLVRSLGYAAALVVLVAVISALTLLPALMGALGNRIESLSVPFAHGPQPAEDRTSLWIRWAERIGRRPLPPALGGVTLLAVLAIPMFQMQLGSIDYGQYPTDTTQRQAYDTLTKGFGVGLNAPLLIAVEFPKGSPAKTDPDAEAQVQQQQQEQQQKQQQAIASGAQQSPSKAEQEQQQNQATAQQQAAATPASDQRLVKLQQTIKGTKGVVSVSPAQVSSDGSTALFSAIPASGPAAEKTRDLVSTLRDDVIPKSDSQTGLRAFVGGQTAAFIDLSAKIGDRLALVIAVVIVLGFLLLMVAFRSIVIPALAALLNLLAVLAAFGVLTAIFELGWGIELIGLEGTSPVVSFVPLMMFAILFGLSMDYQVFLLSRAKEKWDLEGDGHRAVVGGLGLAARVIIAAASIMFAVFASFILNGDPTVKQFGVGLAVAVALDGFVVTTVMPALMLLLGRRTWWFPAWLDRLLPNVAIEGEEYFRALDSEEGAAAPGIRPQRVSAPDESE